MSLLSFLFMAWCRMVLGLCGCIKALHICALSNLQDTLLEIFRAICVHLKHSLAPSLEQGVDHVTGLLRAMSPEISEVINKNGSRDGVMDSRSFPITSSFIRSCSLWIAMMEYDV